jgi:acyl-CoA synthetase (AMP-forming)/AMP-acid ligase II
MTVTRLPLPGHTTLPVGSVDVLPRLAAAAWPDRTALHTTSGSVTFAELDRAVSCLAAGLRDLLGGDGSVVAVSAVPGLDFPVAYYAVLRSGNVVAPVNPRVSAAVLRRLLGAVSARAVLLDRRLLDRVRPTLPSLEQVLTLDGAAARFAHRDVLVEPRDRDENELAVISGTHRTHYGVKLAAAGTVAAEGLSPEAVALYGLPSYHPTHLDAALLSGATQVFCASQDPVTISRMAAAYHATHLYAPGEPEPVAPQGQARAAS